MPRTMSSAHSRPGVSSSQGCELQLEALLERARGHAGGIEALHQAQRSEEILRAHVMLGRNQRSKLLEAELEVAVVIEAVDDHVRESAVTLAHLRDHELLAQVLA